MRIRRIETRLLRVNLGGKALPVVGDPCAKRPESLAALTATVATDEEVSGLGVSYSFAGGPAVAAFVTEMAPHLVGEDPLNHERLAAKIRHEFRDSAGSLFNAAYAAI